MEKEKLPRVGDKRRECNKRVGEGIEKGVGRKKEGRGNVGYGGRQKTY